MHSFELKHNYDPDEKHGQISVLIKTVYSLKLQYPDGIEIDIPRTHRSVYRFDFGFSPNTIIFADHWNWLIRAIQMKTPYEIIFENGRIEYRDDALIWSVNVTDAMAQDISRIITIPSNANTTTASALYLPLEYCREDAIQVCREIAAIYQDYDSIIGSYSNDGSFIRQVLQIEPSRFPLLSRSNLDVDCYIYHQSHCRRRGLTIRTYHQLETVSWLESSSAGQTWIRHRDYARDQKWVRHSDRIQFISPDYYRIGVDQLDSWDMPITLIPRLCQLLRLTESELAVMEAQGDLLQGTV